jgi:hypothetical protein
MKAKSALFTVISTAILSFASHAQSTTPSWAQVAPAQMKSFSYNTNKTSKENGAALEAMVEALVPGTWLEVGPGTYTIDGLFQIDLVGTPLLPIWIVAKPGSTPVLTRSNPSQNTVNVGKTTSARYVALQGFEIVGGDTAVRLWNCQDIWIDQCHIHDCAGVGIEASTNDTARLYLTRNEIHDTGGNGEGMYLGANNGAFVTHDSVVAFNHVHHTGGSQGDGIELKQGSYRNWIVGNRVHDTFYPGILVYGTGGMPVNVVERNTVYSSSDNTMQVQGEAVVSNNLIMDGGIAAFSSQDHQGQVANLKVVHNTIVNSRRAASLADWNNAPGMVFANNAVYSQTAEAVVASNGSNGAVFTGNVAYGPVVGIGPPPKQGEGLTDFEDLNWIATKFDGRPTATGAISNTGALAWASPIDITGALRLPPLEAGAFDEAVAAFANYCSAGTSASGCEASISAAGTPSATAPLGFSLTASSVEGLKNGLFFFGTNGRQAAPWGNGTSFQCVVPPVERAPLMTGTGTNGQCNGSLAFDLNALWCPTCPSPQKNPGLGAVVQAQLWYRDPLSTSNKQSSLSDAIEFAVGL